ncbi:hypothetical protein AXW67_31250 [Bradyrhizobium neotropicale]|uniref:Uncharacterized protein n=1 Tax=Bradyrhizobium neotropicale TaxID=1497615 RepID=A0A176YLM6_9BRAD|nr:hypothetical protein AXW67_31250 [Bradyrhizobium neotropicale]
MRLEIPETLFVFWQLVLPRPSRASASRRMRDFKGQRKGSRCQGFESMALFRQAPLEILALVLSKLGLK